MGVRRWLGPALLIGAGLFAAVDGLRLWGRRSAREALADVPWEDRLPREAREGAARLHRIRTLLERGLAAKAVARANDDALLPDRGPVDRDLDALIACEIDTHFGLFRPAAYRALIANSGSAWVRDEAFLSLLEGVSGSGDKALAAAALETAIQVGRLRDDSPGLAGRLSALHEGAGDPGAAFRWGRRAWFDEPPVVYRGGCHAGARTWMENEEARLARLAAAAKIPFAPEPFSWERHERREFGPTRWECAMKILAGLLLAAAASVPGARLRAFWTNVFRRRREKAGKIVTVLFLVDSLGLLACLGGWKLALLPGVAAEEGAWIDPAWRLAAGFALLVAYLTLMAAVGAFIGPVRRPPAAEAPRRPSRRALGGLCPG